MKHRIQVDWKENLAFEADLFGHRVSMDADPAVGGREMGSRPKPLLLAALAGCWGMGVVSILKRMRLPLEDLRIFVEGEEAEEHPRSYEQMHLVFEFTGRELDRERLEQAVEMSHRKYCGVSALFVRAIGITHEVRIVGARDLDIGEE